MNQRQRFTQVTHDRFLKNGRQKKVDQRVFLPAKVVDAVARQYELEHGDKLTLLDAHREGDGSYRFTFKAERKTYNYQVNYGGQRAIGRLINGRGVDGIMGWPKELRNHLLAPGYEQYDMVHAMPSIMFHFFKHLSLPGLESAIKAIDDEVDGPRRSEIKQMVIAGLQCRDVINASTPTQLDVIQADWWAHLLSDGRKIRDDMGATYRGLVDLCRAKLEDEDRDPEQWYSTALQLFYGDVELCLQMQAIKELTKLKKEIGERTLICCDALFVPKLHGEVPGRIVQILNDAVRIVKYNSKQMLCLPGTDMTDEEIVELHGCPSLQAENSEYAIFKAAFEPDHFFLKSSSTYCWIDGKKIHQYPWKTFVEVLYRHQLNMVVAWTGDPLRRSYNEIGNYPPPLVCPDNVFNLWGFNNDFRAATLPELGDDVDIQEKIQPILRAFQLAVSEDPEAYRWLMCYIADMLQQPGVKRAQYVVIYGEQGVGKNELFERFLGEKIVGTANFASMGTLEDWGHPFSSDWQDKTLVVVGEVEPGDLRKHMGFVKNVMGSTNVRVNVKHGKKYETQWYGRVFMLTNHANAASEDNTKARRIGLRCICSDLHQVEDLLDAVNDPIAQRAFYDYMMEWDTNGWDPEKDRADNQHLVEPNFMTSFKFEPGNFMALILYCIFDRLYEHYRRLDKDQGVFKQLFAVPQAIFQDMLIDCHGWEKKGSSNKHVAELSAVAAKIDPTGKKEFMFKGAQTYLPYRRANGRPVSKPCFNFNYQEVKDFLNGFAEKHRLPDRFDIDEITTTAEAAMDKYHESLSDAGLTYRPDTIAELIVPASLKAHLRPAGTQGPKYQVRDRGQVIFESDDLEEINKELGEAWVGEYTDPEDGRDFRVLHHQRINKDIELCQVYMGEHGKKMLELIFPFYVRDRTA
jgi:hypothetical protein